ncbi:MAG: hypothetical protein ACE5F5_06145 [Acidimicrobiia bacterium]
MRRTCDRPDLREALADGISLDRVEALSRISEDFGLWLAGTVPVALRPEHLPEFTPDQHASRLRRARTQSPFT